MYARVIDRWWFGGLISAVHVAVVIELSVAQLIELAKKIAVNAMQTWVFAGPIPDSAGIIERCRTERAYAESGRLVVEHDLHALGDVAVGERALHVLNGFHKGGSGHHGRAGGGNGLSRVTTGDMQYSQKRHTRDRPGFSSLDGRFGKIGVASSIHKSARTKKQRVTHKSQTIDLMGAVEMAAPQHHGHQAVSLCMANW